VLIALARIIQNTNGSVLLLLTGSLLLGAGCGHEPGPSHPGESISITIDFEGEPVTSGQVDLSGQGGGAPLDADGTAHFKHVPFGEYKVMVIPPQPGAIPLESGELAPEPVKIKIPRQYQAEETTPFSISVQSGQPTSFLFDLKQ